MSRGAHIVAAQSLVGGRIVGSHHFFGETADEARARFAAYEARKRGVAPSSLGVPPGPLVWGAAARTDDYAFAQGERYAVLASVSRNYSLHEVVSYLAEHGWTPTYFWEQGQPTRGVYPVDAWLDSLSPDTTSNHRWVYVEANRTGPDVSIGASAPWPLTFYAIATVFHAVPAPPGSPAPPPALPQAPSSAPPAPGPPPAVYVAAGGAAVLLGGLLWVFARRLL